MYSSFDEMSHNHTEKCNCNETENHSLIILRFLYCESKTYAVKSYFHFLLQKNIGQQFPDVKSEFHRIFHLFMSDLIVAF